MRKKCRWHSRRYPGLNLSKSNDWILTFVREDGKNELRRMIEYLSGVHGEKRILSGYSYWGIEPSRRWMDACDDSDYIMSESIKRFPNKFGKIFDAMEYQIPNNYVSLGVGDGRKDLSFLRDLIKKNYDISYYPVDFSAEMLYEGTKNVMEGLRESQSTFDKNRILALQIDFEDREKVRELRNILDNLCDKRPIIFSLLGNTLANFDNDSDLLSDLSDILLNSNDLLLLEIARIENIQDDSIKKIKWPYSSSRRFKDFAITSLMQATDAIRKNEWVTTECEPEKLPQSETIKALKILTYYVNKSNEDFDIRAYFYQPIRLPKDDKIRLYLSRKYTDAGVDYMLNRSRLEECKLKSKSNSSIKRENIYMDLMLLKKRTQ
jgi:L-histidine N-alpha-methyltransferase